MDVINALKRPFTDLKKLVLGILLNIPIIVNFFTLGYLLEVLKTQKELPEWSNWKELFIHGLLFFCIELIYFIPIMIIAILCILKLGIDQLSQFVVNNQLTITEEQTMSLVSQVWPILLIGVILIFIISYILPSALVSFSNKYKFKDAFKFKEIIKRVFKKDYFLAVIIGSLIQTILVSILSFIPFVGASMGTFISNIILFTLVGEACKEEKHGKKENKKTR